MNEFNPRNFPTPDWEENHKLYFSVAEYIGNCKDEFQRQINRPGIRSNCPSKVEFENAIITTTHDIRAYANKLGEIRKLFENKKGPTQDAEDHAFYMNIFNQLLSIAESIGPIMLANLAIIKTHCDASEKFLREAGILRIDPTTHQ